VRTATIAKDARGRPRSPKFSPPAIAHRQIGVQVRPGESKRVQVSKGKLQKNFELWTRHQPTTNAINIDAVANGCETASNAEERLRTAPNDKNSFGTFAKPLPVSAHGRPRTPADTKNAPVPSSYRRFLRCLLLNPSGLCQSGTKLAFDLRATLGQLAA
jgi:hypothetical protein